MSKDSGVKSDESSFDSEKASKEIDQKNANMQASETEKKGGTEDQSRCR